MISINLAKEDRHQSNESRRWRFKLFKKGEDYSWVSKQESWEEEHALEVEELVGSIDGGGGGSEQ